MKLVPVLVVNPLPQIEDPVLGLASKSLGRTMEAAHLAPLRITALKAQPHQETLFSFTVGNDIERSSGKSAWDICVETLERVQCLNERIAAYQYPEDRIEKSGKFYYFLIRVAGIAGGSVAEAKFMDDPLNDRREHDLIAEHECPNYLIQSFGNSHPEIDEALRRLNQGRAFLPFSRKNDPFTEIPRPAVERTKQISDKPQYYRFVEFLRTACATEPDCLANTTARYRFNQVTPEDVAWGKRQGLNHPRLSARERATYETKLLADVAAYRAKDRTLQENALKLKKSAALYWKFCVTFEFPKVCDQEAMEKAAQHLIKTVPGEHLTRLMTQQKGKRHYVRRGAEDLHFVRQQDLNLATNI